ncbi:MFS general substrate transporter [Lepidopterella palustris CBS 459.81]|uniref:MFS general substrate transporter n=1 Tax=Lepidopterella palustris CBS 459.81 TaxID=1314670 RepID=A0A8E2E2T9_9PEZI|nr:MFS general substrate transporter [Lepidopterella palustris CBS 459.81]
MAAIPRKKWYRIQWYADQDTVEERKLILKLDFLIVPYAFLAYWAKYMDQANLNNAYVAGLKEDLNFESNQLVRLQTMYILGAVLGQIPLLFLFNFIPMFCVIPAMDIAWGIFTLLQYRAHSFAELAAYRFFVGLFEAAFIPGIHYIFGSWYRGHEVARRGGVFYVVLTLGTLTAGLIQAGASARLNGVHGPAGWRWMYIICSVITIPISILGIFILPGTPDQLNKTFLNDKDIELAKSRLERTGHSTSGKFKIGTLAMVAGNWRFWALLLLDIFFGNGSYNTSAGGYLLWLKSLKRYPASRINELGAIAPAVAVAMSSVLYEWVNEQLRYSPAERSFTLVLINTVAQSTTAWTPLLVFKTAEAPRFKKGYPFVLANAICLIILAHIINIFLKRKRSPVEDSDNERSQENIKTREDSKVIDSHVRGIDSD